MYVAPVVFLLDRTGLKWYSGGWTRCYGKGERRVSCSLEVEGRLPGRADTSWAESPRTSRGYSGSDKQKGPSRLRSQERHRRWECWKLLVVAEHKILRWELEEDETSREVVFNIQLSLNALVLVLCMRSGSVSTDYWGEVLDDQLLKAGSLCLHKKSTVLEDGTNVHMLLRRQNAIPFCR